MRFAVAAALIAFVAPTPALATGGLLCKPVRGDEPAFSLVIGHGIPSQVIGANIREGGRWLSTMTPADGIVLSQSWIDRERVWVDVINRADGKPEAKLRARRQGFGAAGTLTRHGRSVPVRCADD